MQIRSLSIQMKILQSKEKGIWELLLKVASINVDILMD